MYKVLLRGQAGRVFGIGILVVVVIVGIGILVVVVVVGIGILVVVVVVLLGGTFVEVLDGQKVWTLVQGAKDLTPDWT